MSPTMRMKIRKYTIHILAITAFKPGIFDLPPQRNAIILCTNRENRYLKYQVKQNKLTLNFLDVEDPHVIGAFNGGHARAIIRFIRRLPKTVTDIYVCCSKGGSRSPAVAAALLRMSGRSDKPVWLNPYYVPNTLVYYILCREAGVPISQFEVWIKKQQNRKAFLRAKRGKPSKYERWQII